MNPETNRFEFLSDEEKERLTDTIKQSEKLYEYHSGLVRPNGKPVPKHWSIFTVDETYVINNYTFRCKYIGETSILFEPVGPLDVSDSEAK